MHGQKGPIPEMPIPERLIPKRPTLKGNQKGPLLVTRKAHLCFILPESNTNMNCHMEMG